MTILITIRLRERMNYSFNIFSALEYKEMITRTFQFCVIVIFFYYYLVLFIGFRIFLMSNNYRLDNQMVCSIRLCILIVQIKLRHSLRNFLRKLCLFLIYKSLVYSQLRLHDYEYYSSSTPRASYR